MAEEVKQCKTCKHVVSEAGYSVGCKADAIGVCFAEDNQTKWVSKQHDKPEPNEAEVYFK